MKRDSIDLRIDEIRELATKYSKKDLARMVQMGMLEPQKAVMAGMMIDRIAKSAVEPPTTTVAEDVLGAPAPTTAQAGMPPPGIMGAPQAPAPSPGVAGLPTGLQNMAGGGIVAFAEGGETDDIPGYAGDKESLVDSRRDPAMKIDPRVQAKRDQDRYQILAQELRDAQNRMMRGEPGAKADFEAIQREMRRTKVAPSQAADIGGLGALIQSAQAAETPAMSRAPAAPAKAPAGPEYMYQDPFGAPDYTTEGLDLSKALSLKQQISPGKPYEPTLQGAIFGYEQAPERSLPPITPPSKKAAGPTTFEPKVEIPLAEEAPAAESRMGPPRPTEMDRVIGGLRGAAMEVPKEKSLKDVAKEQEEADVMYGVDKDMFNKLRQDYKETGGKLKDRADKAAGMAFMMFAAGLAGARQGEEWQTASRAGQQALMSYMGAMDKINDNEDRLAQSMRDLDLAENQYKRSRSKEALAEVNSTKREIRAIELENAKFEQQALLKGGEFTIEMIKNQNPAMYQTLANIAQEQRAKGNKGYTTLDALRDYQGTAKSGEISRAVAFKEYNDLITNPMTKLEANAKYPGGFEDYWRALQGGMAPAGGKQPATGGKVKLLGYEGQ